MRKILITGADRGVGFALCEIYINNGWEVFATQYISKWNELSELKIKFPQTLHIIPMDIGSTQSVKTAVELVESKTDYLDCLINCAAIAADINDNEIVKSMINVNAVGAFRVTESFLPLLEKGERRICFVSSEAGSITLNWRKGPQMGYCMSKAALNMSIRLTFNKLRPKGFTFRVYHPGHVKSYMAGDIKSTKGEYEPEETALVAYNYFIEDNEWEDVLVMRDVCNTTWPF